MSTTTHSLARELLALPDLPVYHLDPSFAGLDEGGDLSLTTPTLDLHTPDQWLTRWKPFATISGAQDAGEEEIERDELRFDRQRLDWVLRVLATNGTDGLARLLNWEVNCPPTREDIDAAMRRPS